MFYTTGEIDYLHHAIELSEKLALTDKGILPILESLREARNKITGVENHEQENTGHGKNLAVDSMGQGAKPLYIPTQLAATSRDSAVIIQNYLKLFLGTGDPDYLNRAIEKAKKLALKDKGIQPLLDHMIADRDARKKEAQRLGSNILQNDTALMMVKISEEGRELGETIQTLYNVFIETNDIDYLDSAIGMAQELAETEEGIKPMLDYMLKIKNAEVRKKTKPDNLQNTILDSNTSNQIPPQVPDGRTINEETEPSIVETLHNAFTATGDVEYLDSAIMVAEGLVGPVGSDKEQWSSRAVLVKLLEEKYNRTREPHDLDILISWIQETIPVITHSDEDRGMFMSKLAEQYYCRYQQTEVVEDFQQAIKWTEDILLVVSPSNPNRATMLRNLVVMLKERYDQFGTLECLEGAIHWSREIIATTTPTVDRASIYGNLGLLLHRRFAQLGDIEDLQQAVKSVEEAVLAMPPTHTDTARMSANLGGMLLERYEHLEALEDLQQAIRLTKDALVVIPPSDPHKGNISSNLLKLLYARYTQLGDIDDLQQAIKYTENSILALPPMSAEWAFMSTRLGRMLESRYRELGAMEDLQQAIKLVRDAIAIESPNIHDPGHMFDSLGTMLMMRFENLETLEDLEEGIMWAEKAVTATPLGSPARVHRSGNLASALNTRYTQSRNISDLEKAIKLTAGAIEVTPPTSSERVPMVNNLGNMVRARFERLGALEDLDKAIGLAREGVSSTPTSSPKSAILFNNLSTMLEMRYKQLGTLEDLEEAIRFMGDAITATLPGNPNRGSMLDGLGKILMTRYGRLGDSGDLEQAIKYAEESVTAVYLRWIDRASSFTNLASMLAMRYGYLGDMEDLQKAIISAERGLALVPIDSPRRAEMSGTLATILYARYEQLKDQEDLQRAIKWSEEAAKVQSAILQPSSYTNLGVMIKARYDETEEPVDLEMAILWTEMAISISPPNSPERAKTLLNFSSYLKQRYQRLGNPTDLEKGINSIADAVAATPSENPNRAAVLYGQAQIVTLRYLQMKSLRDFNFILHSLYEAWYSQVSPPNSRIKAARMAAQLLATKKRWGESSSLLEDAVRMLPKLSPRSLRQDDQEYRLSDFSRLAAETVSTAFQAGQEASYCLRLLELGRGIIMGHVIDCRNDLSELELKHPILSKRFYDLRMEVDSASVREVKEEDKPGRRREVIQELDETLLLIRDLPGFEGFQLPAHSSNLMALASDGPIVIMNTTRLRSDAIIVTKSAIQGLALPKLVYSSAEEKMSQIVELVRGKRSTYKTRNETLGELLLWLWDVAVEPVLQALKFGPAVDNLPQVWWIGVGPLATAPFHAAGDHSPGSTRNTVSHAISSYTPTIKSLSYARERKLKPMSESKLLLVSMPTTPDHPPLENAAAEVEKIMKIAEGKSRTTRMDRSTSSDVLTALPSYHAIHFACHGLSNRLKPSESHLLLQTASGAVDKLTVKSISESNLKNAQIAYLSACSTAKNASDELADESIYIASGFQLAGFSHVLATQWSSNDTACQKVATDFYSSLFESREIDGDDGSHRKVGASFHYAVKRLRDRYPRQPILWAPFIHTGA